MAIKYTVINTEKITAVTATDLNFAENTAYTIASEGSQGSHLANAVNYGSSNFVNQNGFTFPASVGGTVEAVMTLKSFTPSTSETQAGALVVTVEVFFIKPDGTTIEFDNTHEYSIATRTDQTSRYSYIMTTSLGGNNIDVLDKNGNITDVQISVESATTFGTNGNMSGVQIGSKALITRVTSTASAADFRISITGDGEEAATHYYNLASSNIAVNVTGKDVTLGMLTLNTESGEVNKSSVTLTFSDDTTATNRDNMRVVGDWVTITLSEEEANIFNFTGVKAVRIIEGIVVRILDSAGNVLWNGEKWPKVYTFTITATNEINSDSKEFSITVNKEGE